MSAKSFFTNLLKRHRKPQKPYVEPLRRSDESVKQSLKNKLASYEVSHCDKHIIKVEEH